MKYRVFVVPDAWEELKDLPGDVRQRIRRLTDDPVEDPRPEGSKQLHYGDLESLLGDLT